ncbi:MAG: hypothetical protein K1X64_20850 [Myxococcaceae bacterium]|nr:hypothetical protein [Myxococcaceae bacterium]
MSRHARRQGVGGEGFKFGEMWRCRDRGHGRHQCFAGRGICLRLKLCRVFLQPVSVTVWKTAAVRALISAVHGQQVVPSHVEQPSRGNITAARVAAGGDSKTQQVSQAGNLFGIALRKQQLRTAGFSLGKVSMLGGGGRSHRERRYRALRKARQVNHFSCFLRQFFTQTL